MKLEKKSQNLLYYKYMKNKNNFYSHSLHNININLILKISTIAIMLFIITHCKYKVPVKQKVKKLNTNFTEMEMDLDFIKLNEGYTNYIYIMNGKETAGYGFQDLEKIQPIKDIINNKIVEKNIAIQYVSNKILKEARSDFLMFLDSRKELVELELNNYQKRAILSYMYKRYYSKNPVKFLKSKLYKDILSENVTEKSFAIGNANRAKREFLMYIHP